MRASAMHSAAARRQNWRSASAMMLLRSGPNRAARHLVPGRAKIKRGAATGSRLPPKRNRALRPGSRFAASGRLAGDAVLHPAVLLDQMDTEIHRVRPLLALRLLYFVGVALSGGCGVHSDERYERERGDDRGQLAHNLLLEGALRRRDAN